jgi:hypothetical protein
MQGTSFFEFKIQNSKKLILRREAGLISCSVEYLHFGENKAEGSPNEKIS